MKKVKIMQASQVDLINICDFPKFDDAFVIFDAIDLHKIGCGLRQFLKMSTYIQIIFADIVI